jgi:predicted nucleic-acid-binding protein
MPESKKSFADSMHSVDTNIVIRYLMNDDPGQSSRARAVVDGNPCFLSVTVVLESAWVLRSVYRMPPGGISKALREFMCLPTALVERREAIAQALGWFEQGMDFADALHLATAQDCDGLVTFDRDFIKSAARIGAGNVAEP